MFTVKMFINGVCKTMEFFDIVKAMKFFDDIQTDKLVPHAKLICHHRVTAEF